MGMTRRGMLKKGAAGALAAATVLGGTASQAAIFGRRQKCEPMKLKGNFNHSVCHWCFTADCSVAPISLEQLCINAKAMGIKSVELVDPDGYDLLKKYGLVNAMCNSHGFVKGFNDKANHEWATDIMIKAIDGAAECNFPNVITFPGFRNGISDEEGLENCVVGLKPVVQYAEKKGVTVCMEVLNSRVDIPMKGHPDYQGDSVEFCGEICKQIGSERMKILFDIYHIQIMQGDIITRIKEWKDYIGHYHTAGNPGRNELDDNQEINYPPIMKTIVETGYDMYVGHEFIPTRSPMKSLKEAVLLCDV